MSEINSIASLEWIKYALGGIGLLVGIINVLIMNIFSTVKNDIKDIKKKQDKDHDRLNRLLAEHYIHHKEV